MLEVSAALHAGIKGLDNKAIIRLILHRGTYAIEKHADVVAAGLGWRLTYVTDGDDRARNGVSAGGVIRG